MQLPDLKSLVDNNSKVYFDFYSDGELWYRTESGFQFPITIEEAKGDIFKAEDKAILFMRYIRKHIEFLEKCLKNITIEEE